MREFRPVDVNRAPHELRPHFREINDFLSDVSAAVKRLSSGTTADNIATIVASPVDTSQFVLMTGRASNQIVKPLTTANVGLAVQGLASQTGDLMEWLDSANHHLVAIGPTGTLTLSPTFGGTLTIGNPGYTQVLPNANGQYFVVQEAGGANEIAITASNSSPLGSLTLRNGMVQLLNTANMIVQKDHANNTTPTLAVELLTGQTTNLQEWQNASASALSSIAADGTATLFAAAVPVSNNSVIVPNFTVNANGVVDAIPIIDTLTGNLANIVWPNLSATGLTITLPPNGGNLLTDVSVNNVSNKTLLTNIKIACNTVAGVSFQDNTDRTKQMRLDLSGIAASKIRNFKLQDTAGSVPMVGNAASAAGVLGIIDLTAQTTSLGAQTMLTGGASTAGQYRLSFYLSTTTAGAVGDTVSVTVSYNDGAAQTIVVPLVAANGSSGTTLDLSTLNAHGSGAVVVYSAASQNITFTTTVSKTGTPQYQIHARIIWVV